MLSELHRSVSASSPHAEESIPSESRIFIFFNHPPFNYHPDFTLHIHSVCSTDSSAAYFLIHGLLPL